MNFDISTYENVTDNIIKTLEGDNELTREKYFQATEEVINDKYNLGLSSDVIKKYSRLLGDELNQDNFDEDYLQRRRNTVKQIYNNGSRDKMKRDNNPIKIGVQKMIEISSDLTLFLFTIGIVAHLRIRSFINTCYLYPSDPTRFPYVFYDTDKPAEEQHKIVSILNTDVTERFSAVFGNLVVKEGGESDINSSCPMPNDKSEPTSLPSDVPGAVDVMNKQYKKAGERGNINFESSLFMDQNRDKTDNELNIISLVTYVFYYSVYKLNGVVGSLHDKFGGKKITSSSGHTSFAFLTIFLYMIFKSNVIRSNKTLEKIMKTFSPISRVDGASSLGVSIFSTLLSPFMSFFLLLFLILYPFAVGNSIFAYNSYANLSNQLFTKLVCYFGVLCSSFTLLPYFASFIYFISPDMHKDMMNILKKWGKDDAVSEDDEGEDDEYGKTKTTAVSPTITAAADAAQSAVDDDASAKEVGEAATEATKNAELKDKNCKDCRKMNTRRKKKNCKRRNRRNRCGKEGFTDSKGCSTKNAMKNMNFSRLLALSITGILAIISIFPILLPILSAGLTSLRVAGSLTFKSFDNIKEKLNGIKNVASMIPIVFFILMGGKLLNNLMNGGLNGVINNLSGILDVVFTFVIGFGIFVYIKYFSSPLLKINKE